MKWKDYPLFTPHKDDPWRILCEGKSVQFATGISLDAQKGSHLMEDSDMIWKM